MRIGMAADHGGLGLKEELLFQVRAAVLFFVESFGLLGGFAARRLGFGLILGSVFGLFHS